LSSTLCLISSSLALWSSLPLIFDGKFHAIFVWKQFHRVPYYTRTKWSTFPTGRRTSEMVYAKMDHVLFFKRTHPVKLVNI
jgi:hypothetical protein